MDTQTERQILDEWEAARAAGGQVYKDTGVGVGPVTSDVYSGDATYQAEIERIFWRSWIPVARVSDLLEPGRWLHESVERSEVILTRDEGGTLHAFHNTCMHRGSALVSADGCGDRLVCPYHAWSYKLDGQLAAVTEPIAFPPDFDASKIRLGRVHVTTKWGWIWVNLAKEPPSIDEFLGPNLLDELTNWQLEGFEHKGRTQQEGAASWKVVVEGFIEAYHVPFAHPKTVNPVLNHRYVSTACWGDHSRTALPLRDPRLYEAEGVFGRVATSVGVTIPARANAVQRASSLVYLVWPCTIFNIMPNHFTVFQTHPLGPQKSRITIDVFGAPSKTDEQRAFWEKLCKGYIQLIEEDFRPATTVQRGLSGAFQPELTLTHYDRRIRHFRNRVDAWLG